MHIEGIDIGEKILGEHSFYFSPKLFFCNPISFEPRTPRAWLTEDPRYRGSGKTPHQPPRLHSGCGADAPCFKWGQMVSELRGTGFGASVLGLEVE